MKVSNFENPEFSTLGSGIEGFRPKIRILHANSSPGTPGDTWKHEIGSENDKIWFSSRGGILFSVTGRIFFMT